MERVQTLLALMPPSSQRCQRLFAFGFASRLGSRLRAFLCAARFGALLISGSGLTCCFACRFGRLLRCCGRGNFRRARSGDLVDDRSIVTFPNEAIAAFLAEIGFPFLGVFQVSKWPDEQAVVIAPIGGPALKPRKQLRALFRHLLEIIGKCRCVPRCNLHPAAGRVCGRFGLLCLCRCFRSSHLGCGRFDFAQVHGRNSPVLFAFRYRYESNHCSQIK